ncbi:MAG: hypothetical protein MRJ92_02760 [Nitrospira sp.]|nr:hypothetical protein [Nitrospira sp.]
MTTWMRLYRQALARLGVARAQLGAAKPELEEATLSFRAGQDASGEVFCHQVGIRHGLCETAAAAAASRPGGGHCGRSRTAKRHGAAGETTSIRAPFDGLIVKKLAEIGGDNLRPSPPSVRRVRE